jgi:hypothetical protein
MLNLPADKGHHMADLVMAIEQDRVEMLKAFRQAEKLYVANKSARESLKKVKNENPRIAAGVNPASSAFHVGKYVCSSRRKSALISFTRRR